MWTSPVATQSTSSRSARSTSQRLRALSERQNGRCSSTLKRSGPKAPTSRRPSASAAAASAARGLPARPRKAPRERPVASAAREADEPLGPLFERAQRQGGGERLTPGRRPRPTMSLGDQPAEVPPPLPALDEERQMERLGLDEPADGHLGSPRSGEPRRTRRPGRTPSPPRRRRGRSGRGHRVPAPPLPVPAPPAPTLHRRRSRRSGSGARRNHSATPPRPCCALEEPATMPLRGSRKTTTLRPSASTSSK